MKLRTTMTLWLASVALAFTAAISLQNEAVAQGPDQIYGSQLMTEQERLEYRERLRAATTAEERERIRAEHHERMQERAEERGVTLPEEPPMRGKDRGGGQGAGQGVGQGTGSSKMRKGAGN